LIIASLLLLVAMVGAVGLTLKRPVAAPHYDVFAQHYVDFQKVVVQIPNTERTITHVSQRTPHAKNSSLLFFFISFSFFFRNFFVL
jgi:hypothetical protein